MRGVLRFATLVLSMPRKRSKEQRGRVFRSRESLHAVSVEVADPDADRVARGEADAPGIAMAVGRAGFPGDARCIGRQFPSLRHVGSAQLAQDLGDHCRRFRGEDLLAACRRRRTTEKPRRPMHASLGERGVEVREVEQAHFARAEDQRQAIVSGRAVERAQSSAPQRGQERIDAELGDEMHGRRVERLNERVARGDAASVRAVVVLGHVAAVIGGDVEEIGLGNETAVVDGLRVEKWLERRTRRATRHRAVILAVAVAVKKISRSDQRAHFSRGVVDHDDRGVLHSA